VVIPQALALSRLAEDILDFNPNLYNLFVGRTPSLNVPGHLQLMLRVTIICPPRGLAQCASNRQTRTTPCFSINQSPVYCFTYAYMFDIAIFISQNVIFSKIMLD